MKKFPSIGVPVLALLALVLGSIQGQRLDHLQECERLYRWMVSASTQMRLFGDPGKPPPGEDPSKYADEELFKKLVELTESRLPDVPVGENDYDKATRQPFAKVVRYTAAPHVEEDTEATESETSEGDDEDARPGGSGAREIYTEEQRQRDAQLWAFARSPEAADLRKELWNANRDGRVAAFGTQLGIAGMYQERGTQISLANLFFGFRKMAANLVWLEVDRWWHKGQMHRMLPLMKTCVTLDPEFIDAYLLGAWHMAYNASAPLEDTPWEIRTYDDVHEYWVGDKERFYFYGVDFLKDGIRKNPRNYKLYFDLGFSIYDLKLDNHVDAIKYLSEAIRLDHDRWVRRCLYRLMGVDERYEASKTGWEDYLSKWPDNQVAKRFINLMTGEILGRDADYAGEQAKAAEELAKRARDAGNGQAESEWSAKAAEARAREAELYVKCKSFWKSLDDPNNKDIDRDTYAQARSLRIEAAELRSQGRYDEAIQCLDIARFRSNEFWDTATDLLIKYKVEGNLPLFLTDTKFIERQALEAEYTRHLPKSIAGRQYRFFDGAWMCVDYKDEPLTPVEQDSDAMLQLKFEHPEIARVVDELDGNIILQAGNAWYEYRSKEPAMPSKLYAGRTASLAPAS
ncbi:MAG: hypothetical protein HUU46_05335 [Candidatus Hydrogenedentes bacterium]|nr:hypothetical protein [Candidatus Hydrogenedentota bacterium]